MTFVEIFAAGISIFVVAVFIGAMLIGKRLASKPERPDYDDVH